MTVDNEIIIISHFGKEGNRGAEEDDFRNSNQIFLLFFSIYTKTNQQLHSPSPFCSKNLNSLSLRFSNYAEGNAISLLFDEELDELVKG